MAWYDCGMIVFYLPGNIPIYSFSILIALGACLGLAWIAIQLKPKQALPLVEAGMWVLVGGLIGGRLLYVAVSWLYFRDHLLEGLQFYRGGLAWPGALAGGLLALAIFATLNRLSLATLADDLLPLLATLSIGAWLGCWLSGSAYGVASNAWWSLPTPDEWGVIANRWPIQIWGAVLIVGLFALLDRLSESARLKPGYRALLGLLGLSLIQLGLTFLRADPGLIWYGLRLEAWGALIFCLLSIIGLLSYTYYLARDKSNQLEDNPIRTEQLTDNEA
jgi:phosphatidylglycerol:prolipoprotein diacylglycerol transferase